MRGTDELRGYAQSWRETPNLMDDLDAGDIDGLLGDLEHIADRIDAEHQKAEDEWRAKNGDMWQKGYAVCHAELMEGHPVIAADLEKAGWVKLPVDADGVPIHIGDVMEWCDSGDTLEVIGIGDDTLFYVDPEGDRTYAEWTAARNKRHHHAPTVEDVLTEFGIDWEHESDCEDRAALLKEYAAKLRLAEEDA